MATPRRRVSLLHVAVLLNTALVMFAIGGFLYTLSGANEKNLAVEHKEVPRPQVLVVRTPPAPTEGAAIRPATTQPTQPAGYAGAEAHENPAEAVSWEKTEASFQNHDYRDALAGYGRMLEVLHRVPAETTTVQFCQLRIAQCMVQLGRSGEGRDLLVGLLTSSSPIIRAVANHEAARTDLQHGQYMQARMKLYTALACLGSLEVPIDLERDCDFQVARAMTQQAISLLANVMEIDWKAPQATDPFGGLDQARTRALLNEGTERLGQAAMGPMVWKVEGGTLGRQWAIVCIQSPLEEVLSRFAAEAKLEVRWNSIAPEIRRRPVTLLLSGVSQQRFAEVACGTCGLLARLTGEEVIVHDPVGAETLSGQRELLVAEAVSAWRRFFLRAPDDPRSPRGYLALAVLEAGAGDSVAALRDAQLTAERFTDHDVAPLAMLLGASIRMQLRDYNGARADLLKLLDRYPNCPTADQAYVNLGNVTAEAGLLEEAIGAFNKLYYLNLTAESRSRACLGLGKCHFRLGRFAQAVEWLDRCLASPVGLRSPELAEARMLLGQAAAKTGDLAYAQRVLGDLLADGSAKDLFIEAGMKLADVDIRLGRPALALSVLRELDARQLSDRQREQAYLLSAQAMRSMGLPERAAQFLRGRIETVTDLEARLRLSVELARCLVADGDQTAALAALTEAMSKAPPGPVSQETACFLAEMALKAGKLDQAVAVTGGLLITTCSPEIRQRALEILAAASILQRDYKKAAEACSGMLALQGQEAKAP